MTKPNFIRKRLILLFKSDDILEQEKVLKSYNKIRNKMCYCGHTTICDCANPGKHEFLNSLETNSIPDDILNKLL